MLSHIFVKISNTLVKQIKSHVRTLPCLGIPTVSAFKDVETDASDFGYGGILKQRISPESPEQIVRFYSGMWNNAQLNYSTIKKEIQRFNSNTCAFMYNFASTYMSVFFTQNVYARLLYLVYLIFLHFLVVLGM